MATTVRMYNETYPAPEPDLIEQLSKGNVPGHTSCPDSEVTTSL